MKKKTITLVAFGDSITLASAQAAAARWPEQVREALQKLCPDWKVRMINAGVGGNTSREGLARLEQDVLAHRPDLVTVEFGGNDATSDPQRHVTLEEFVDNLEHIRQAIVTESGARVVMLTFTPVVNEWHSSKDDLYFKEHGGLDAYVESYREATRLYARQRRLPLADIDRALREAMAAKGAGAMILPDGVHLTDAGNTVVAEAVTSVLAVALKS